MRIHELSLNPAKAFSSSFDKASDAVDTAFSPKKWAQAGSKSSGSDKPSVTKTGFEIEKYQLRNTEAIMQAVVNGDVSALSTQQRELAAQLLQKLRRT